VLLRPPRFGGAKFDRVITAYFTAIRHAPEGAHAFNNHYGTEQTRARARRRTAFIKTCTEFFHEPYLKGFEPRGIA
jgi:hypothetical protein